MMDLKTIAVVGPGGNVGRQVIKALLEEGSFSITAIIRPTSTYTSPPSSLHFTTLTADFDSLSSIAKALENQDALVCCVPGGATHFAPQRLLIDAAIAAGVKLFVASEFSADITSERYKLFPTEIVGDKLQIRRYLEEKAAEGKIAWTALNGGPFFDMWREGTGLTHPLHPTGFSLANHTATIYDDGSKPLCWTPLPTAAAAVVRMLCHPQGILNRAVHVRGVRDLTQNALLEALESQTGRKFSVERADTGALEAEVFGLLKKGETKKAMKGLTIWAQFGDGVDGGKEGVDNEAVGVVEVTVAEAVREVLGGGS
ncbi:MAG: hypothetical protein LQ342_001142 [Letrouitia transgressa]|nr:MAG: hypothetical protein LQ342_001142 [Letrouitia transgressa]